MDGHSLASKHVYSRLCRASLLWIGLVAPGCATATTPPASFVECPLSITEQQQAMRKIVPIGTSREQAADRLTKEGIEFTTGAGDSIYYCSTWKRPDGTRWHMNVAMLFDRENKLYQFREANSVAFRDTDSLPESTNRTSRNGHAQNSHASTESANSVVQESDRVPFSRDVRGSQ